MKASKSEVNGQKRTTDERTRISLKTDTKYDWNKSSFIMTPQYWLYLEFCNAFFWMCGLLKVNDQEKPKEFTFFFNKHKETRATFRVRTLKCIDYIPMCTAHFFDFFYPVFISEHYQAVNNGGKMYWKVKCMKTKALSNCWIWAPWKDLPIWEREMENWNGHTEIDHRWVNINRSEKTSTPTK